MRGFVLLLILLKVLGPIRTAKLSKEYDITRALGETIVGIFQSVEPQNIGKLISNVVNNDDSETLYKFNYSWWDGNTTITTFRNIEITHVSPDTNNTRIYYGILDNAMKLYFPQFVVQLSGKGDIYKERYDGIKYYQHFNSEMHFGGFTVSVLKQSNISGDSFLIDLKYNKRDIDITGEIVGWPDLKENFERMLPSILRTHMNCNKKLLHALGEIYDMHSLKSYTLKYHQHLDHESLYHYLISNVASESFNLRNIVVKGLTNFHSLSFTTKFGTPTYVLLIKNVRGGMILEDAGRTTSTLELQYFVESLSIFVNQEINCISVQAENYLIIETEGNTRMTNIQSEIIMDQLERGIGSSIMPAMEYKRANRSSFFLRRNEMDTAIITQILIEKSGNPMYRREHKTANIYNYQYHISFPNMNINLLSTNPQYPHRMQCPLPTNSQFSYRINVGPNGEINSSNKTNTIDINFNFNYPSVNVSLIKPNNSQGNDSCEFQIRNNRDVEVELSPPSYNTTESEGQLEIKKKIDATLLSMTKDCIVRTVKPIICLPFDVCSQTVKMVDDFFSGFVDIVLKKCSFRRNNVEKLESQENK